MSRTAHRKRITRQTNLKAIRQRCRLSQSECASALEISLCAYKDYETGKQPLNADLIELICELFYTSPNEILAFHRYSCPRIRIRGKLATDYAREFHEERSKTPYIDPSDEVLDSSSTQNPKLTP